MLFHCPFRAPAILLALVPVLVLALATPSSAEDAMDPGPAFALAIEKAHGSDSWYSHDAVAADLVVHFGGNKMLEGRMITTPEVGKTRLELSGGAVAVWDGERAWVSPASVQMPPGVRFHVLTWPYFLAAPMKLRDPGAHLEPKGEQPWGGETYDTALLTFDSGVGDSPDDWYLLYRDRDDHRLTAMAYIVTYGGNDGEAEPHAIVYEDFETVGGSQVATHWTFYNWSEEQGIHGDPIGEVRLSNLAMVTPEEGAFTRPSDAREGELPGG